MDLGFPVPSVKAAGPLPQPDVPSCFWVCHKAARHRQLGGFWALGRVLLAELGLVQAAQAL